MLRVAVALVVLGASARELPAPREIQLPAERHALMDFANSTNISGWVRSHKWQSAAPVCDWELVGCDGNGSVKTLSLSFNNLVGTLPTSIGALSRLEALDLEGNHMHGIVPKELGALDATLVQIGLGLSNQFGGALPPSLCPILSAIVQASPSPHAELPCDLGGTNLFTCPLPCATEAALCGARCGHI